MKNPLLGGARAKIDRAIQHLQNVDVAVGQLWAAERQNAIAAVSDSVPCYKVEGEDIIVFHPHSTPVDPSLTLIVGDCIHNTRSALDHLVYQLAILNRADPNKITRINFPVCLKDGIFKDITSSKIAPFIDKGPFTEIKKLQPYSTGNAERDILWILSQLDIIDKHRLLIVTQMKVRPTAFVVTNESGQEATAYLPPCDWKASEAGTELLRFKLAGMPPGKVKMQVQTAMTVQIERSGLSCDGMIVQAILNECIQYTLSIIDGFGRMFFSE